MRKLAILLSAMSLGTATATAKTSADADAWPGVIGHRIDTRAGRITIYLPDDIRAGDTISGTILAEPSGNTESARTRNRDTLNGYVYDAADRRVRRVGDVLTFTVPAAGLLTLAATAGAGKSVGKAVIHARATGPGGSGALPTLGQAGRPQLIPGAFDGDLGNTRATIGNRPVEIIAESPRGTVIKCPDAPVGATTLQVHDGGTTLNVPFHNAAVSLAAAKTVLNRGETTTVSVLVEGLPPSIETELVQLTLVGSPTIRLEGGNAQQVALRPDAGGVATFKRQVTALSPGPYEVGAQLVMRQDPPKRDPLFPDALDMNGIDSVKQLLGIVAGMNDDARTALLQATLKALKRRLADAKDEKTRKWLEKKIKIVEGAMDALGIPR
jgi:hypothetical protein